MTDHRKSASEIEREIEQERSALSDTLDGLRDQFSPERMMQSASDQLRTHGGDMAQSVGRAVKENPMALALTGIGIAWLIAGSGSKKQPASRRLPAPRYASDPYVPDPYYDPLDPEFETYAAPGRDRFSTGDNASFSGHTSRDKGDSHWSQMRDRAGDVADQARAKAHDLREGAEGMSEDARARAAATGDDLRHRADRTAADLRARKARAEMRARGAKNRAYRRASEMMERINAGTEDMSAEARRRVHAARMRAIDAQHRVEQEMSRRSAQAREFANDQPLLAGALAMAVGAAIGAALPRTRMENEAVGEYRDQLMDEADRVFREEAEKLRHVAQAAVSEGQDIAEEKMDQAKEAVDSAKEQVPHGKEAVDKTEKEAKTAGNRVAEAAQEEAERQNLGRTSH